MTDVADVANYRARIVPTLPTLTLVLTEQERKDRLAYWVRDTMGRRGLTPPKVAERVGVSRSTVTAWAAGRSVPSMIYLGPLAAALRVDPRLFADLPVIPPSGAAEYLVDAAESAVEEGVRRGRQRRVELAPNKPARSTRPHAPDSEVGHE